MRRDELNYGETLPTRRRPGTRGVSDRRALPRIGSRPPCARRPPKTSRDGYRRPRRTGLAPAGDRRLGWDVGHGGTAGAAVADAPQWLPATLTQLRAVARGRRRRPGLRTGPASAAVGRYPHR